MTDTILQLSTNQAILLEIVLKGEVEAANSAKAKVFAEPMLPSDPKAEAHAYLKQQVTSHIAGVKSLLEKLNAARKLGD